VVQTIKWVVQLSQRSGVSPQDRNDQDGEHQLLVNELPVSSPHRSSRTPVGIPRETATTTSSRSVPTPSRAFPVLHRRVALEEEQSTVNESRPPGGVEGSRLHHATECDISPCLGSSSSEDDLHPDYLAGISKGPEGTNQTLETSFYSDFRIRRLVTPVAFLHHSNFARVRWMYGRRGTLSKKSC
jgi:hypothetical protein